MLYSHLLHQACRTRRIEVVVLTSKAEEAREGRVVAVRNVSASVTETCDLDLIAAGSLEGVATKGCVGTCDSSTEDNSRM